MKPFTKSELKFVIFSLLFIFIITGYNLRIALRKSRDSQRMSDLGSISDALNQYQKDYGFFPPSENGMIKACKADNFDEILKDLSKDSIFDRNKLFTGLKVCNWGQDQLRDLTDDSYKPYLDRIPSDPKQSKGISYFYISDTNFYQIYAYLEGEVKESAYNIDIVKRNLKCGNEICNFGKSYSDIPLGLSIEEYERMLLEMQKSTGK